MVTLKEKQLRSILYKRALPEDDEKGRTPHLCVTEEANVYIVWKITSKGEWVLVKWFAWRDDAITFAAREGE